jgi:hypothetical protein
VERGLGFWPGEAIDGSEVFRARGGLRVRGGRRPGRWAPPVIIGERGDGYRFSHGEELGRGPLLGPGRFVPRGPLPFFVSFFLFNFLF